MHPCQSNDNFTSEDLNEINNFTSNVTSSDTNQMPCREEFNDGNQNLDWCLGSCIDNLLEDGSSFNVVDAPFSNNSDWYNTFSEELFIDVFKLEELDQEVTTNKTTSSDIVVDTKTAITDYNETENFVEQPLTCGTLKRPFVEEEQFEKTPNPKRIDLKESNSYEKYHYDSSNMDINLCTIKSDLVNTQNNEPSMEKNSETKNIDDNNFETDKYKSLVDILLEDKELCDYNSYQHVNSIEELFFNIVKSDSTDMHENSPCIAMDVDLSSIIKNEQIATTSKFTGEETNKNKSYAKIIMPDELTVLSLSYKKSSIYIDKSIESIYESAIKKIVVDEKKTLRTTVLTEFKDMTKYCSISYMDLSETYSNVREYILERVSPYIKTIITTADIKITPGMSISDIRSKCISNNTFLSNLSEYCIETVEIIRKTPDTEFFHIIQNNINLGTNNFFKIDLTSIPNHKKNALSILSKNLIIETISDLTQKIIYAIKKFKSIDICAGLFSVLHGAYVSKSFIKDLIEIYNDTDNEIRSNKCLKTRFDNDQILFDESIAKNKLKEAVENSVILYKENTYHPNWSTKELMIEYLLSDMINIFYDLCSSGKYYPIEVEDIVKNYAKFIIPRGIVVLSPQYKPSNIFINKHIDNIYEYAIKNVFIDKEKIFSDTILKEFKYSIEHKIYDASNIDMTNTYSKVREYILKKMSHYTKDIVQSAYLLITPGMHVSDIRSTLISNQFFLNKIEECRLEITEMINITPPMELLRVIQQNITIDLINNFNLTAHSITIIKRDALYKALKKLIIDTVSNLKQDIIFVIENLSCDDISSILFLQLHGANIIVSSIKNIINIYEEIMENESLISDLNNAMKSFFRRPFIKKKLEKLIRTSIVLHEGITFLPNDDIINTMTCRLFSDMTKNFLDQYHLSPSAQRNINEESNTNNLACQFPQNIYKKRDESNGIIIPVSNQPTSIISEENGLQCFTESLEGIYEYAVRKIIIDEKRLLKKTILAEFKNIIDKKGFDNSCIDISETYSNVHKYIVDRICPYINNIIHIADVKITSQMFISEIKIKCTSNHIFFSKLSEGCVKIIETINRMPNDNFLSILQSKITFDEGNVLDVNTPIMDSKKNILSQALKSLIIDTISNITHKITYVIRKFRVADFRIGMFSLLHGVYIDKSFIRNVINIYKEEVIEPKAPNHDSCDNDKYIDESIIRYKLEKALKTSVILLREKICSLEKSEAKLMIEYLLSDIIKASNEHFYKQNSNEQEDNHQGCSEIRVIKELTLMKSCDIRHILNNKKIDNLYECAIRKISIDDEEIFRNLILMEIKKRIKYEDLGEPDVYIAEWHSRVRKYVSNKISPHINDIIQTSDVLIPPGTPITNIGDNYISNIDFFCSLGEYCKKILTYINKIPSKNFELIVPKSIRICLKNSPDDNHNKIAARNYFYEISKSLVMDTISKLPQKISSTIKNFELIDICNGVFLLFRDIYITKSLMRNIINIYNSISNNIMENTSQKDNDPNYRHKLFDQLCVKTKLEEMIQASVIVHKGNIMPPDKLEVNLLTGYLLASMIKSLQK
ncbi:hypothetical protein Ark11_1011 [Candidatus Ichthyocystis hellenicum]|uniref:Uncharacterized protein n=1 Tax=Candidatus Ichthyocystis hellenicum TaxID=1561003 RepID=A0A0S4M6D2_9BURK|nr:hypothetical protein [Candidatus Ichthyocystis hellenicum]CUT17830.1 hypothetical protein Ark11_1011 [Candidatus Ichthyocystis hellenicum]